MTTTDIERIKTHDDDRLDVPGVITDFMLLGSVKHAMDVQLLKNLQVSCLVDAENPRKRSKHAALMVNSTVETARMELDDDFSYDEFKSTITEANKRIQSALSDNKTVFVFCTHGNNESAVVCIAYLMVVEQWSLEHAYRHVLQKRPASAPRKIYMEKLRTLEMETHGRVTLRSNQIGPSMMDIMLGLRGQSPVKHDIDERSSQATEGGTSTVERASVMSNFSVATGRTNGRSIRETTVIAEQDDDFIAVGNTKMHSPIFGRKRSKGHRGSCVIS